MHDKIRRTWMPEDWTLEPSHLPDTRKWHGYGYVYLHPGNRAQIVHKNLACLMSRQVDTVPFVVRVRETDDGYTVSVGGNDSQVKLCERCPEFFDWDWQAEAACLGAYQTGEASMFDHTRKDEMIGKFCDSCPVVLECLDWAETTQGRGGVYGGTWVGEGTTHANRAIDRQRARIAQRVSPWGAS